jgi:beta-phosphoglucomutase-like phosphatase (HAD superfamily)
LHYDAWKENCDDFGLQFSRQLLVETAGNNIDELLSIIIERSNVSSTINRDEVNLKVSA